MQQKESVNVAGLPDVPDTPLLSKSHLLAIGIGVAAFTALTRILTKTRSESGDPPPVIVKTGSFEIESDQALTETEENSADPPGPTKKTYVYRRKDFGAIRGVRVFRINESTVFIDKDRFSDGKWIEVDIRLEAYIDSKWVDIGEPVKIGTEPVSPGSRDFTLRIGRKLKDKNRSKKDRPHCKEDDGKDIIRFGQIIVREAGGWQKTYNAADGDRFLIAFYPKTI